MIEFIYQIVRFIFTCRNYKQSYRRWQQNVNRRAIGFNCKIKLIIQSNNTFAAAKRVGLFNHFAYRVKSAVIIQAKNDKLAHQKVINKA